MKRGRKSADDEVQELIKSTFLLTPTLRQNLAYLALAENKQQADLVREAISQYLDAKGLNPEKPPIFTSNKDTARVIA